MNRSLDRLYELLPVIYRLRDYDQGEPLRTFLKVIAEQVQVVEEDVDQLYQNWFIETCQDWVAPYIGDLIGYQPVHEAGEPGEVTTPQGQARNKILIPRREVANTVRYRRRKGTLALLEELAKAAAGWPARAVEFYTLLGWTQALNHLRLARGRTADLRNGDALDRLDGPFDELAHTVDVRRINSHRTPGWYNIPSVGLFVWRLREYPVTRTPTYCRDPQDQCYTFSILGNDTPLYTRWQPEGDPAQIAGEMNLPVPIRRRALEKRKADYYGPEKSLCIFTGSSLELLPMEKIVVADLTKWQYKPDKDQVAVDPELGRMVFGRSVFRSRKLPEKRVSVSYYYGFSADLGGGEYNRPLFQPDQVRLYLVQKGASGYYQTIGQALEAWKVDKPEAAVIEIGSSDEYTEPIYIELAEKQSLQLRAANHTRPVIRQLNWGVDNPDAVTVYGAAGSSFTLDGLLIVGRGLRVEGDLRELVIRHSTLVPGWELDPECEPVSGVEPSLALFVKRARVTIEHSILGSIQVTHDEVTMDPIPIHISDSILDATGSDCDGPECFALSSDDLSWAHVVLRIERSTVLGRVQTHAIELAENSIFMGQIGVGRSQHGCMRFCYVPPASRTPRRYNCQPDLVEQPIRNSAGWESLTDDERARALEPERLRVRPQFNSMRYGKPTYCQLANSCAEEIKRGADDDSEMGAFHDLYQPQRAANLRARLDEYTPAGMEAGIIYAS